ncbi:MAG: ABC transporter substrate-binding protein [Bacillota bacterium]
MKKIITLFLCLTLLFAFCACGEEPEPAADTRTVTDMAGREVDIPADVETVFATGAVGGVFMYTLAPDMLAAWNGDLRDSEKAFIDEAYWDLPALGTWKGTNFTGSMEDLIALEPDIIISMGDVTVDYASEADEIESLCGIPVVMVDGGLGNLDKAYTFLGDILNRQERAEELGAYCSETLAAVEEAVKTVPEEEIRTVYYGEGVDGLETEVPGSLNAEAIAAAGGVNVAETAETGVSRISVSLEQVAAWDPDVILLSGDGDTAHELYQYVRANEGWATVPAAARGDVFENPYGPYDWINRPPSVARIIGVEWLARLLYPEAYPVDLNERIRQYYSLFYHRDLTDEEITALLEYAG